MQVNELPMDDATRALLRRAEVEGLGVLGMRDYTTVTLPELAFEHDNLVTRVEALERVFRGYRTGAGI